jgi:hypothetical protein
MHGVDAIAEKSCALRAGARSNALGVRQFQTACQTDFARARYFGED